jgi:hypothetical protein
LSPFRLTCPAHLILFLFYLISPRVITLGEEYKLSCSLCSFLQPPVPSSLFGPNILPRTVFSKNCCTECPRRQGQYSGRSHYRSSKHKSVYVCVSYSERFSR